MSGELSVHGLSDGYQPGFRAPQHWSRPWQHHLVFNADVKGAPTVLKSGHVLNWVRVLL